MQTRGQFLAVDHQYGVGVPLRHEVMFKDGSAVWLHRVQKNGAPDLFTRAVAADGTYVPATDDRPTAVVGGLIQIDLRRLAPELEADLPVASTRDVPGIVMFSLRKHFKAAGDFLRAAQELAA